MTILPQLERDLYEAARQRLPPLDDESHPTDPRADRGRHRQWDRLRPSGAVLSLLASVVIALVIGGFALELRHPTTPRSARLGHQQTPRPGPLRARHRFRTPAGEDMYPLGAVATKTQLLANFAVLRRAQDTQDRSWRPDCSCGGAARQFFGLTRYVRTLHDGTRVFFDVEQFIDPGQLNMASGSYVLNLDLVSPSGKSTSGSNFGPNTNYLVFPMSSHFPLLRHGAPNLGPRSYDWIGVIPDGVATVRWTFSCVRGAQVNCAARTPRTYTVPVINNTAAQRVPDSGQCPACLHPVAIQWLSGHGTILASFGHTAGNIPAPPFVKGGRGARVLGVLNAHGIGQAQLGQPSESAIAALNSLLGPAAQTNASIGGCGVDHESVWTSPAVDAPLTIYQHQGRFVGYQYGAPAFEIGRQTGPGATLRTALGLTIGNTIGDARRLYGATVTTRVSHGVGSWQAMTRTGSIRGSVLPTRYPLRSVNAQNPIITIQAGDTSCNDLHR